MAKRFHVVHECWAHVETQCGREIRRLNSRIAAFALKRFDQASLFAADISACSAVDVNLGVESGAENIFSKEIVFPRFFDGAFEDSSAFPAFASDLAVARDHLHTHPANQPCFRPLPDDLRTPPPT